LFINDWIASLSCPKGINNRQLKVRASATKRKQGYTLYRRTNTEERIKESIIGPNKYVSNKGQIISLAEVV
jgi:hypothetical protein